ncbi:MAG: VWA domain-containing protein [Planctomycetaceae bacterium]
MSSFRFHDPFWLLALVVVLGVFVRQHRRKPVAVLYSDVTLLRTLPVTLAQQVRRRLPWLQLAGLVLIVLALARPQFGLEEFRIRTEGIAIQMCIDRSGSMQAMDFPIEGEQVNRLDAVKHVFQQFVSGGEGFDGRPDDLIGLIAFGGYADAKCPPTLDHGALLEVLKKIEIPRPIFDKRGRVINEQLLQEEQATAIGDALALAVDRLKDTPSKSKVIVLLSDGENTAGVIQPEEAAEAAAAFGIRIYAIGIGTTGTAPYPGVDLFGRQVLQSRPVRLDEETLKMLAEKTSGQYFNAQDTQSLVRVYEQIDQLEKTETEGTIYTEYRELFPTLLTAGFICILLQTILAATWLRGLP